MQKTLSKNLTENLTTAKALLPAEDVLTYAFTTQDNANCALVYADGMVNKELLGSLVSKPLSQLLLFKKDAGRALSNTKPPNHTQAERVLETTRFPELKEKFTWEDIVKEILDGNTLLLVDGIQTGFIVGAKLVPVRAVIEPPTGVAVKGPREGFIEDVKTNMALVRKRLKTPALRFETVRVGKRSDTAVCICFLDGIAREDILKAVREKLGKIQIDNIPDSSYISAFLSPRKHSLFRAIGTTEKPDIFCAKLVEGRVGLLVDGSPIALTLPFILTEDLQTSEDYFISPFMATIYRAIRFFALCVALLLPAFYVTAQLFKLQLLPLGLTLTIAGSVQGLPLSPSMEIFVVVLLLEILKEASTRMPKYVGMSLSVVGALVLGETAVRAGLLSTTAIIVVAISGICLYTVPNFVETGSVLRWIFLLVAGSEGGFGIVLLSTFLLYYLVSADGFGAPLLAPFSPLCVNDLKDTAVKYGFDGLKNRPKFLDSINKTRFREKEE